MRFAKSWQAGSNTEITYSLPTYLNVSRQVQNCFYEKHLKHQEVKLMKTKRLLHENKGRSVIAPAVSSSQAAV